VVCGWILFLSDVFSIPKPWRGDRKHTTKKKMKFHFWLDVLSFAIQKLNMISKSIQL
jgi:hypothetical protein